MKCPYCRRGVSNSMFLNAIARASDSEGVNYKQVARHFDTNMAQVKRHHRDCLGIVKELKSGRNGGATVDE